ncbi:MAG: hypothetical protein LC742_09060 [Acidobacteria bacterium]|nr:hypothetical protein [Acidobacteriota bacterium]
MSQNINRNDPSNTSKTTGGAGTGATDLGTTRDTRDTGTGLTTTTGTTGSAATGTATAKSDRVAGQAQEYGQKIADAATQAKDYVSDKLSVAGDKLKDLQNKDFTQVAEDAKQYARERPGQALLVSAAAGFLIGLLLRNSRR